jgi:hypothetical protein
MSGRYDILLREDRKAEAAESKPTQNVTRTRPRRARVSPRSDSAETAIGELRSTGNGQSANSQVVKQVRPLVRRTFDFYEDQIEYLTSASLHARLAGHGVSMNAMIREAIDHYIEQKTSKK